MDRTRKTDRVLRLWLLLLRSPERYSTRELAEQFHVTTRTIYRDLECLQYELRVPVYDSKGKWAVDENYYLPPIRFTTSEALCIFLAARLLIGFSHRYDPHIESTFRVLSSVLQPPLGDQVEKTLQWMHKFPRDERQLENMAKLAEGWTTQRRLKITTAHCRQKPPPSASLNPTS